MILLTKLDNSSIYVNVDKIQSLLSAPDTVVTFTNRERMIVKEPVEEISKRIADYQKTVHHSPVFEMGAYQSALSTVN